MIIKKEMKLEQLKTASQFIIKTEEEVAPFLRSMDSWEQAKAFCNIRNNETLKIAYDFAWSVLIGSPVQSNMCILGYIGKSNGSTILYHSRVRRDYALRQNGILTMADLGRLRRVIGIKEDITVEQGLKVLMKYAKEIITYPGPEELVQVCFQILKEI